MTSVYLGSILLEPNRWKKHLPPVCRASEWSVRAREAGFDGWELWGNHFLKSGESERDALADGALAVGIFNSYASFAADGAEDRAGAIFATQAVGARAMKFNVGNDQARLAEYRASINDTVRDLSAGVRLLCECHPGTWFEDPGRVAQARDDWWEGRLPFGVIIHPFLLQPEEIVRWGSLLGASVRHAHVQLRAVDDPARFLALGDDPGRVGDCLAAMREIGFAGTYTLEFARATRTERDLPGILFDEAVEDLRFLRSCLADHRA